MKFKGWNWQGQDCYGRYTFANTTEDGQYTIYKHCFDRQGKSADTYDVYCNEEGMSNSGYLMSVCYYSGAIDVIRKDIEYLKAKKIVDSYKFRLIH